MRPCPRHPLAVQASAAARGYTADWARASAQFLMEHPLCAEGCGRKARVVDHKEPHRGDPVKFWDRSNWQALCKRDHGRKTARQDGGFGNARKKAIV